MSSIKKLFLGIVILLFSTFAFADNWYVCAGSYGSKANADELITSLQNKGIPAFAYEFTKDNGVKLYRVLIDEAFSSADDARDSRDFLENDAAIKALRISGLWICQAEKPGSVTPVKEVPTESVIEEVTEVYDAPVETPSSEYIKIVLKWEADGMDLDAVISNSYVFIDYDNTQEGGMKLVQDENAAIETVYVDYLEGGETYSFYVLDADYADYEDSTMLSESGANVSIYANGECIATFDVTPDTVGTTWHVFDITPAGSIKSIDDISNESLYE